MPSRVNGLLLAQDFYTLAGDGTISWAIAHQLPSYYAGGDPNNYTQGYFDPSLPPWNYGGAISNAFGLIGQVIAKDVVNTNAEDASIVLLGSTGGPTNALAQSTSALSDPNLTTNEDFRHDIWIFDSAYSFSPAVFQAVVLHEALHSLGLRHSHENLVGVANFDPFNTIYSDPSHAQSWKYSVMSYVTAPVFGAGGYSTATVLPSTLQLYDIWALQFLYGVDTTTRAGNGDIYGKGVVFDATGNPKLATIWDAGGDDDTLDASSSSTSAVLDLRQGEFSSIGDGNTFANPFENIAIAWRTVIENAIGTSADDIIIGNIADNEIHGGGGNDVLFGDGDAYAAEKDEAFRLAGIQFNPDDKRESGEDWVGDGTSIERPNSNGSGADIISGGDGDDAIYGGAGDDLLYGEGDDDRLVGGTGNDDLHGDAGVDHLVGGAGADLLDGGADRDWLEGGDDADFLEGGSGKDMLSGGAGNDQIDLGADNDSIDGGAGFDTAVLSLSGSGGFNITLSSLHKQESDGGGFEGGGGSGGGGGASASWSGPDSPQTIDPADWIEISTADTGVDRMINVERLLLSDRSDTLKVLDLSTGPQDQVTELSKLKLDYGTAGTPALNDDMLDLSAAGRTVAISLFGVPIWSGQAGVKVDLRNTADQTVRYRNNWGSPPIVGWLTGNYYTESDVKMHLANANSVIGTQYDDILIGSSGKMQKDAEGNILPGEGYSTLHGGGGNDFLAGRGWESHLFGDAGKDEFSVGSNTWVEDGEVGDTVDWGIRLTGGVNQWWQQSGYAYWAPFSSLSAAFPVIGSELIYTAAFFTDQVTMKFARYRLDDDGTLEVNLWGQTANAAIRNYKLDLTSGVGTAGVTVYSSGHGTSTSALGKPARDAGLERLINLALKQGFGVGFGSFDPLVLDLDGDGYNLTSEGASKAYFEFDSDGFAEHTGWVRATDGFLVRDANANGKIDSVAEMFGSATTGGFDMLAGYDSNFDGVINASDSVFAELQVWQDLNQNGVTDAGELKTLSQLGIVSISLASTTPASPTDVAGNTIAHEGSFTRSNGTTGAIADVSLAINETNSKYLGDNGISLAATALPQLDGFGEVRDLRIAMSGDATLLGQVSDYVANTTNDLIALKAGAESILYRWASVDGVAATALGSNGFDTRKLAFLEKYSGYELMPRAADGTIDLDNLDEVEALWANQITRLTLRLVVQGPLANEFSTLHYDAARDLMIANSPTALADLLHARLLALPADATEAATVWADWAPLLGALSDGMIRSDANAVTSDYLFAQLVGAMDGVSQPLTLAQLAAGLGIADVRIGTSGAETLVRGTAGETAIYFGQGGNDTLAGGTGQDVYVFGRDVGHTVINDNESSPSGDRIRFAFLGQDDIKLTRDGSDLLITVIATGETVRVTGQFADVVPLGSDLLLSSDKGVEDIQFADGSIMEIPEIMAAVGKGTDGNDHLVGTMHSDVLTGGKGDDLIEGGDDADLYVFNRGDGNDLIHDQQTSPLLRSADLLVLGDDIAPEDITYSRTGQHGEDLLITVANGGGSLLVQGEFAYTSLGYNGFLAPNSRIEMFAFRNYGDAFTNKELQQQLIAQGTTAGNDVTLGFGDDDIFVASAGNDVLIGMDGADTYDWGAGSGNDIIREQAQYIDINVGLGGISLTVRADVVQFNAGTDPSTLIFTRNYDTDDLVIINGATGETLTVDGQFNSFQTGVLGAQWFDRVEWFAFADGSAYSWKDVETMVTTGSAGNDRLRGDILADTMVGGHGNDLLSGGGGGDTYVFNAGDGQDTVFDDNQTLIGDGFLTADQTIDVIQLGAGIAPGDISFARDGSSITLIIGSSGDRITLQGQDDYIQTGVFGAIPTSRIEQVKFADGTIWSWQDLNQKMIAAQTTAGNDVTDGFTLSDRFEKSAGDDMLRGGDSADTYVFGVGAGHDTIQESVSNVLYGDDDSVEFDATVAPADVSVARDGNDLIFTLASGDSLRVAGEFDLQTLYTWTDVENFRFTDGTVWTKAQVQQRLLQSTSGNDHLVGFYSSDDLDGGAGNDILEGGDGSDTYHFDRGYGNDEIRESVTEVNAGDFDTLAFGPGLLPEDLGVARDGNDLVLTVVDTGETMRVTGQFNFGSWFAWNDVELFTFTNGTTWTDRDIATRLTGGTTGDDHLIGTFRSDTLDGKEGNDLLEGGDGSDIYIFGRGYGHDEIRESLTDANLGEDDEVRFGAGITLADLGFARDGDNLVISILGTDDTLTLTGEFTYSFPYTWNDVERFTFADGSYITKADVSQKVLTGSSANDHIIGFGSNDTLDGGAGDDVLEGVDGSDTYRFGVGDGHDTVIETLTDGRTSEFDTLAFKDGVLPGDVTVTRDGQDAIFTLASGDSIRVVGHFNEGYNEFLSFNDVEQAVFADGTVWDKVEIDRRSIHSTAGDDLMLGSRYEQTYDGGAGNDTIYGGNANDTLIGGTGNDRLEGDGGDDTYLYNLGDGDDVIHDYNFGNDGADRIVFGEGIAPSDLRFSNNPADGSDIIISFANAAGSIRVQNQWWGEAGIEGLVFADGTVWNQDQIAAAWVAGQETPGDDTVFGSGGNDVLAGGAGNDHLLPGGGDDIITGGAGNDRLEGDAGNDTYVYNLGDGEDVIYDYNWNNDQADRILFGAGITPETIHLSNNGNGSDVRITFGGSPGSILIQSQWQGDAGIESFEFADGTIWDQTQIAARFVADQSTSGDDEIFSPFGGVVNGGAGNDLIHTGDADDVITGGTGNDRLESGYGNDRYIYNLGDGNDVIYDYSWNNDQADRIVFGAGITPGTIHLANNGNGGDVRVTFDGSAGSILIQSQWQGDAGIESFEFADGTIWDQSQIAARFVADQSTSGNDEIFGSPFGGAVDAGAGDDVVHTGDSDDIVTGGLGNDRLESGYGNDRYIYNLGDGNDVIYDYSWNNDQADRIVFGAGITADDILVSRTGNNADLKLSFKHGDGSILIQNQDWGDAGIETLEFADGSTLTQAQFMAMVLASTPGNDTLTGTSGADELWGLEGDDTLRALAGDDVLGGGAGADLLVGGAGDDTLEGGAGNDTLFGDDDQSIVAVGPDLIVNGSFEDFGGTGTYYYWGANIAVMPGWVKATSAQYEAAHGNATDGSWFIDLEAYFENMDISQSVSGLTQGSTYLLQFDSLNTGSAANGFELYWNGQLVEAVPNLSSTMTTFSYAVVAAGTGDTVRFVSTGPVDNAGVSLDNVRLHATAAVTGAGDDILNGGAGDDVLVGGGGTDTAIFRGAQSDYQLSTVNGALVVTDLHPETNGDDGSDTITGVETLQFSDGSVSLTAPVILDLDGNGVAFTPVVKSNAMMDMNGDGVADRTSWIDTGDAFLFLDRNHDGTVSGVGEISFTGDKPGATSDLEGLGAFDSNGDGLLSVADTTFVDFGLWRDANGDGRADASEISSLFSAGISSIGLSRTSTLADWSWGSGITLNNGSFIRTDGTIGGLADAALAFEAGVPPVGGAADDPVLSSSPPGQPWHGIGALQHDWVWQQFDPPRQIVSVDTLDSGSDYPLSIGTAASILAQTIASFDVTSAGEIAQDQFADRSKSDLWLAHHGVQTGPIQAFNVAA